MLMPRFFFSMLMPHTPLLIVAAADAHYADYDTRFTPRYIERYAAADASGMLY